MVARQFLLAIGVSFASLLSGISDYRVQQEAIRTASRGHVNGNFSNVTLCLTNGLANVYLKWCARYE